MASEKKVIDVAEDMDVTEVYKKPVVVQKSGKSKKVR